MTSLVLLILPTIACGFRLEASVGKETSSNLKAASNLINCGCQCSSLTFVDSAGQVQGNCRTVDSTGARWCYTSHGSTCQDLTTSTRFPSNPWSYEACATPPLGSYQCPNNIVAPSLVAHPFLPPATVVISSPSDHTSDHLLTPTSTFNDLMVQTANPDHPMLHIANSGHVSSDSSSGAIINSLDPNHVATGGVFDPNEVHIATGVSFDENHVATGGSSEHQRDEIPQVNGAPIFKTASPSK